MPYGNRTLPGSRESGDEATCCDTLGSFVVESKQQQLSLRFQIQHLGTSVASDVSYFN